MPSISVVIPVYNAEAILPKLVDQISAVVPGLATEYELVLVNDGSTDESWAAIQRLGGQRPELSPDEAAVRHFVHAVRGIE